MGTRSDREKSWDGLHLKDGKRLTNHPSFVFAKSFLTVVINDGKWYSAEGEAQARRDRREISGPMLTALEVTMTMEEMNALLRQSNEEVDTSLAKISQAYNKVVSVKDVLIPDLHSITKEILQARMSVEREMGVTLTWLKTVREFFLEKSYETEMAKIKEFIAVCKEIQKLKETGVLNPMADLAIKLAVQEEVGDGKSNA